MKDVAIYTLTSELHDAEAVGAATRIFLGSLHLDYDFRDADYADYGSHVLSLIYVRTGGTEGVFRRLLPELRQKSERPTLLLTSGKSNSLAASMEILSFLRQQGLKGEIIHGSAEYVAHRVDLLAKVEKARRELRGTRLGIVGKPSDWLISSTFDRDAVSRLLGIELVDVPMADVHACLDETTPGNLLLPDASDAIRQAYPGAVHIYRALRLLVEKHRLNGFTIRCFDLLSSLHNTGCWALARLNADGIVAGCEGDVPALLSMKIAQAVTGVSGFQANPATIDPEAGEMLFAHCTIPINMVERYELDTHFESGIGIGIRGFAKPGPVTIFKLSGDLSRHFIAQGELVRCEDKPGLCRTQQVIRLDDKRQADYFLTDPIGNHHIVLPGHRLELLEQLLCMQ